MPDTQRTHTKKRFPYVETSFILLGYPDSNQERQDQNLQCYHYTIPQTEILCRSKSLICGCKGSAFF